MWFSKKHREPINPFSYHESGFSFNEEHINWNDIRRVIAFKEDLITVDCIYITIELETDEYFSIHEDTPWYDEFMKKLEENIQISQTWFSDVAFPPFERNETVIYDKSKITFNQ
ncbi:hypothetical protein FUA48_17615 [Flavobacterium alkalisoli]|uniref:Uncharacterized protein n=1 Tax=Flavobacterium alkalisoli TaxID=2602769 RepID=A0A5B9FZP3_9FLAO|nr:hypothetical protein [Flavobacterium alkalisoli]QEE51318.1 hypothetical protein FUA48_17615 [Flavobacterium alkalisoli]